VRCEEKREVWNIMSEGLASTMRVVKHQELHEHGQMSFWAFIAFVIFLLILYVITRLIIVREEVMGLLLLGGFIVLIYFVGGRFVEGSKNMVEMKIDKGINDVKNAILHWLKQNGFRMKEDGGVLKATKRHYLARIHFDLKLTAEDEGCALHGEFYAGPIGGGGPPLDFREKCFWMWAPRKKGFELMNEFLKYVSGAPSLGPSPAQPSGGARLKEVFCPVVWLIRRSVRWPACVQWLALFLLLFFVVCVFLAFVYLLS